MSTRRLVTFVLAISTLSFGGVPALAAESVLVAAGATMTYRANTSNPGIGTTWTSESFVPSGWSSGSYGVGYETAGGAAALIATGVSSSSLSVYTRTTFSIANVATVQSLFLGADYDDGYIAWINGVEVFRSAQMPGGAPDWNTSASSHESSNGASPNYGILNDISTTGIPALHNGTNVLAIGVWNTGTGSSDLVLVPRLSINRDSVSRGPYLQLGTPSSVTVRWRSDLAGDACVRYGTTLGSLTSSACNGASTTEHVINVSGLAADTKYFYSVGTSTTTMAGDTSDHFFVTSPPAGTSKPTRVWVLGDSGTADANARAVRDAFYGWNGATPIDLWLMLGDNAYQDGTDAEYQAAVFDTYPATLRKSVLWPTLGNHDGIAANSASQTGPYYASFTLPAAAQAGGVPSGTEAYYSFDYGNIHFICLESYETDRSAGGAMMTWLEADLADTTEEWIVAFFHHPPYSKGSHNSDTETELLQMRQNALPLLEEYGVDLVLSGHSHSYERSYLLDGHYGVSSTFNSSMQVDAGSGREEDTGAYEKTGGGPVANEGAVYIVAGSSGQTDAAVLNHPVMFTSLVELGSVVLDIDGDRMDVQFLDDTATVLDWFTMLKNAPAPACGNGVPEAGEDCDDANMSNTDACLSSCQNAFCGDGFTRAGVEECDDANMNNGDGCLNTCLLTSCGDGFVQAGEQCDDADDDNTDACLNTCQNASCGDGFTRAGVEQCDDGNLVATDACTSACLAAACGDGFLRTDTEQCDDGNLGYGDGCSGECLVDCPPTARSDCRLAEVSILRIVYAGDPAGNVIKWKWLRGGEIALGDVGDPTALASYNLCFYPNAAAASEVGAEILLSPQEPWASDHGLGYRYRDSLASNGGVSDLRIRTGPARKTKVQLRALGADIPSGLLPAESYAIQLHDVEHGSCWSSSFASGARSDSVFKSRSVLP